MRISDWSSDVCSSDLLSYSYVAPLAAPEVLPALPKYLFDRNSPMRFRPALDPEQWRWGLEFLLACTAGRAAATTRALLALAFHSRAQVHEAVAEGGLDFAYSRTGKLVVYSDDAGLEGAKRQMDFQRTLGCEQEALDRAGCLAVEPARSEEHTAELQSLLRYSFSVFCL